MQTTPWPIRIVDVRAATHVKKISGADICAYHLRQWCSTAHTRSKPICSAQVKAKMTAKYRDAYAAAARAVEVPKVAAMHARGGPSLDLSSFQHEAAKHPGYADPVERLRAMDLDGVQHELLFSDLSAFRVLHRVTDGWRDAARAINDCAAAFASAHPQRRPALEPVA